MSKHPLREYARGQDCLVRVPGVCCNDRDTTVLAHINERSLVRAGMGQKVPDMFGAISCHACHELIDGRAQSQEYSREELLIMHYQGMVRTQYKLLQEGMITF